MSDTQLIDASPRGDERQPVWGEVQPDMEAALATTPTTVEEVLAQLALLQSVLERLPSLYQENPVADFNRLYQTITRGVLDDLHGGVFQDPAFMALLDVEFAKRYLVALRRFTHSETDPPTPSAWTVLLDRRDDPSVRPIPAAAAGVNAHVNFDLAFALLETLRQLDCEPRKPSPQCDDYRRINDIFHERIPDLRGAYENAFQRHIDRLLGSLDDWFQGALLVESRDLAWVGAERIWAVRDDPELVRGLESLYDHDAALIGRALLSPFGEWIQ
jgi:hypothetical protein